jgi:hypothetical protein
LRSEPDFTSVSYAPMGKFLLTALSADRDSL